MLQDNVHNKVDKGIGKANMTVNKNVTINKNVTRKDVALKAGVSVSVVSRAINNSGYVEKREERKNYSGAK